MLLGVDSSGSSFACVPHVGTVLAEGLGPGGRKEHIFAASGMVCTLQGMLLALGFRGGSGRCPESHTKERFAFPGKLGIKSSKAGSMCLFLWLSLGGSFTSSCCWWPRLREAFGTVPPDFICSPRNGCFPAFFPSSTIPLSREGAFWVEEQLARLD